MTQRSGRAPFGGGLLALAACVALAWSPAAIAGTSLKLGDGRVTDAGPDRGSLYVCDAGPPSDPEDVRWTRDDRWLPDEKPRAGGKVEWPAARIDLRSRSGGLTVDGNGYPDGGRTGAFPPDPDDDAAPYLDAGRAIREQRIEGELPNPPRDAARDVSCVRTGEPVGVATDGVPILAPTDSSGLDLVAREVRDRCDGLPADDGLYAYRAGAPCLSAGESRSGHSERIGWARDGAPIHGPRGEDGSRLANGDLDECHGHVHGIRIGGERTRRYHYHATDRFPYLVGCFNREPDPLDTAARPDPGPTRVDADPGLTPGFDPDVTDYATRCAGEPVQLGLAPEPGTSVRLDDGPDRGGEFAKSIALESGQSFSFDLRRAGERTRHHVRCLPSDFPDYSFERLGNPDSSFYLVTPNLGAETRYVAFFDDRGVPVWWYEQERFSAMDAKVLSDGSVAWARAEPGETFGLNDDLAYEVRDLDGDRKRVLRTVGSPTDGHELQELGNGNYLLVTYRPRDGVDLTEYGGPADATIVDAEIQELEPDGDLVWSWNSKDHVDLDEAERWWPTLIGSGPQELGDGREGYDPIHINSVEPDGGSLVISLRHTDAVYSIDRGTGDVRWKLGGTTTPESLTVEDDPHGEEPFGGQHDARILDDDTLTVHDNATVVRPGPRAVRYEIDEDAGTAKLLEEIEDPDAPFSFCCGSARRSDSGAWLMAWGGADLVTEFDSSGERTFKLQFGGPFTYRAVPVTSGEASPSELREGMDAMAPPR